MSFSILSTVLKYAPEMLDLIKGAPAEQVAGRALRKVTGADGGEGLARLNANPELQLAFAKELGSQRALLEQLALADRRGARSRDLKVRALAGGENHRADMMIIGDVIGLLACLGAMVYVSFLGLEAKDASPILMALNGPLGMLTQQFAICLRDAHQFEFGSSRGSRIKDELRGEGKENG